MPNSPHYHKPDRPQTGQRKKHKFLNSKRWRGIRARMLARFPHCHDCGGPATEVHHIDDSHANNTIQNLMCLCKKCHSKKTVAEDGGFGRPKAAKQATRRTLPDDFRFG